MLRKSGDRGGECSLEGLKYVLESQVESLLEAKADVNSTDDHGVSPLMLSSSFGHREVTCIVTWSENDE